MNRSKLYFKTTRILFEAFRNEKQAKDISNGRHSALIGKKQIPHSLTKELMSSEKISF